MIKKRMSLLITIICLVLLLTQSIQAYMIRPVEASTESNGALLEGNDILLKSKAKAAFDEAISSIIDNRKATGAVAVLVTEGESEFIKGYGFSDKEALTPVDPELTGFRIGSISKTFVAIAAMLAVQEGKLELNTDITKYLEDDFPKLKYPVTMHQLLTHTAGFEDVVTGIAVDDKASIEPLALSVRKYRPQQITKPGEVISYSNFGIVLAAYVIERVTGVDIDRYCQENIYIPLGMNHTSFRYTNDNTVVSKAYLPEGREAAEPYINMYPEGAMITTAEDMKQYIHWLLSDQDSIIQNALKKELFARNFYMADELNGIGYTWNIKSRNDVKYYEKKGETVNFYSRIVIYPSCHTGLFFSFNTYVSEEEIDAVTAKVTEVLLGKAKEAEQSEKSSIDISGSYVNLCSSFKTAEKILRYIIPDRMIKITGNTKDGFKLNGERVINLGNNTYSAKIGTFKMLEQKGKILLATDFSQTYVKIRWWESKAVILSISVLFLISTLVTALWSVIALIKKKKIPRLTVLLSVIQLLSLLFLISILLFGIVHYSVLNYIVMIHLAGYVMLITTILSFVLSSKKTDGRSLLMKYFMIHNIISAFFCLVLFNLNFM